MKQTLLKSYCSLIFLVGGLAPLLGIGQPTINGAFREIRTVGKLPSSDSIGSRQEAIKKYYHLAKQYKDGEGVTLDNNKAFYYFSLAADLGDPQSIYAEGYCRYKGLGCTQDYQAAANLFQQGAYAGRDNSMYFYGLLWRNGYYLPQNEDSAQYWLNKAAALGYKQAQLELQSNIPENGNTQAVKLVQKIHNAAIPNHVTPNRFIAIQPQMADSIAIAGAYQGYVIQYDWSGCYPVSTKKLQLFLEADQNKENFTGKWLEESTDSVRLKVALQKDSLVFDNTRYERKDHYSQVRGIEYDFRNASLNLVRKGDSVYLAGNIYMFSPSRKEPSKPLFIALTRTLGTNTNDSSLIKKQHETLDDGTSSTIEVRLLRIYPNPFTSNVNVEFSVSSATEVGISLYNMAGQKVYSKPSQRLDKGAYKIRIEPPRELAEQALLLRLASSTGHVSVTLIKK